MLRRSLRSASLVALIAASGCHSATTAPEADLSSARSRWALSQPASYQFTLQRSCECGPSITRAVTVVVRNGVIAGATYVDTGADAVAGIAFSVDGLFGVIDDAIARKAAVVAARYDETRGFPVSIFIDQNAVTVDDEFSIVISNFQAP